MVDAFEIVVETFHQVAVMRPVQDAAGLADGVHAPHRRSDVHCLDSRFAGNDGSDSAAAG